MTLGQRVGKENYQSYVQAFGYKEKTGIDLPGEGNSIFTSQMSNLDLMIYAFGQNFNVTPIQQITAVSAVANGGSLVTPYLVDQITDESGNIIYQHKTEVKRTVVSEEVCKTISGMLEEGVSGDGGAKNAYVPGYRIAAKTGTSEKKNEGSLGRYICSTVAFAPADNPQYAVIIMVDEPTSGVLYGSTVAAPYVGNVMETILPYLGVEAVYTEAELEKQAVAIPSVSYWTVSAAKKHCESKGITLEVVGNENGVIKKQYPEAGTVVEKSAARIVVYTEQNASPTSVSVPDLTTGWTAKAANDMLKQMGLNIRIEGTKNYLSGTGPKIISQSIAPGEEVPIGTVIEVTLRYLDEKDYDEIWNETE
jgi:stage V sporulation protein D (sporulation-specific penicillin-binding protein)